MTLTEALVKGIEQAHNLLDTIDIIDNHLSTTSPTLGKLRANAQQTISELTYWLDVREGVDR